MRRRTSDHSPNSAAFCIKPNEQAEAEAVSVLGFSPAARISKCLEWNGPSQPWKQLYATNNPARSKVTSLMCV